MRVFMAEAPPPAARAGQADWSKQARAALEHVPEHEPQERQPGGKRDHADRPARIAAKEVKQVGQGCSSFRVGRLQSRSTPAL
jgi:hypothetical protein